MAGWTITGTQTNTLLLSWTSLSTIFKIQTNSSLASSQWAIAGYSVVTTNGTNHAASIAAPDRNLFFRLKK